MSDERLTETQIRFQCELEGTPMPDECIRQLAEARACRLHDIDGETKIIINLEGVEILKRYAAKQNVRKPGQARQ
jgi:hypothetical protein